MVKYIDGSIVLKIVLMGDSTVGKSCLMIKYANNYFPFNHESTIGVDLASRMYNDYDPKIKIQLWDTAGQERYRSIASSYYRAADCVILCYDITNKNSFDRIHNWIKTIHQYCPDDLLICLVGTKTDLNHKRVVKKIEADSFAKKLGIHHYEISSKKYSTEELDKFLFDKIVKDLLEKNNKKIEELLEQYKSLNIDLNTEQGTKSCCYK